MIALGAALDRAISGDTRALYDLLARGSGLPGTRPNLSLAEQFGDECSARGAVADRVAVALAALDPDVAKGGTALEFLPVCGVTALGARAATDRAAARRMLATMHDCADDLRFRVRDAVVAGLARVGSKRGEALVDEVASWTDGFFHAAAVVRALAVPAWLSTIGAHAGVIARLDESFALARDATRAAARYPGHKALVEALASTPGVAAARFGVPVFDMLERWTAVKEPALRDAIAKNLGGSRLAGRFGVEIARVKQALAATAPVPRDPRSNVGPTRKRGKRR
jgi:hypothetical protein